jgi:hypothetical protein
MFDLRCNGAYVVCAFINRQHNINNLSIMARQDGIIKLTGGLGDISFYKTQTLGN